MIKFKKKLNFSKKKLYSVFFFKNLIWLEKMFLKNFVLSFSFFFFFLCFVFIFGEIKFKKPIESEKRKMFFKNSKVFCLI
jgi:hypothetical protein